MKYYIYLSEWWDFSTFIAHEIIFDDFGSFSSESIKEQLFHVFIGLFVFQVVLILAMPITWIFFIKEKGE